MQHLRVSLRVSTFVAALSGLSMISMPAFAAGAAPDLSGVYQVTRYNAKIELVGGGELPLTPAGKAAYDKNIAGLRDGSIVDQSWKVCVPEGIPRVLANPYPFEILQAPPGQVTMIYELNHQLRNIAMDKPVPSFDDLIAFPYYNGHSYGRYEGDTLVIVSRGFNEKTFLDATGAPHTDLLETTERIRKISATQLENVVTIRDPMYYMRDFQVRFVYNARPDIRLQDYVCGEEHRDISNIPGVRRP